MPAQRRVTIVTDEILGLNRNGGAGTANTFLSFTLARLGHDVEILFTLPASAADVDPVWTGRYQERGVRIDFLGDVEPAVPKALAVPFAVERRLRARMPHVVIAHDWFGPAYTALVSRHLDLGFTDTTFVVYCHGPTSWIYEAHQKLRRSDAAFELEVLEHTSVQLADAVVSPSAYLIDWMQRRGWSVANPVVAPYFTHSGRVGVAESVTDDERHVARLVFFGRLEERKGIQPFLHALNELDPTLLSGIELVFLGKETPLWSTTRVEETLAPRTRAELQSIRFEVGLDQPEAIVVLKQPRTLAVMPSLVDNSPNVIYECLEHGVPFLASGAGGGAELIAPEDRARALVEPTAGGVRVGLERFLSGGESLRPVRASFDPEDVVSTWQKLVTSQPSFRAKTIPTRDVLAIVVPHYGAESRARCVDALERQSSPLRRIVTAETSGFPVDEIRAAGEELILLLTDGDVLEADCLETLLHAQSVTDADVVTCGVRHAERAYLFFGDAGEAGLIANRYGLTALYRRSVLASVEPPPDVSGDIDWILLARLSLGGARIVSVPRVLVRAARTPGDAESDPIGSSAALAVVAAFEDATPPALRRLPMLAATLAARRPASPDGTATSLPDRIGWIWEREGALGLARRGARRASRFLPVWRASQRSS